MKNGAKSTPKRTKQRSLDAPGAPIEDDDTDDEEDNDDEPLVDMEDMGG